MSIRPSKLVADRFVLDLTGMCQAIVEICRYEKAGAGDRVSKRYDALLTGVTSLRESGWISNYRHFYGDDAPDPETVYSLVDLIKDKPDEAIERASALRDEIFATTAGRLNEP